MQAKKVFDEYGLMEESVAIYVPCTINVHQPIDNKPFVDAVSDVMAEMFGGVTSYDVEGGWMTEAGVVVRERVTVIKAFCKSVQEKQALGVIELANWAKKMMGQEAIAVQYNNSLAFV